MASMIIGVNGLAVLVCAIVAHGLGALWYGKLFTKQWMRLSGLTEADMKKAKEKGMAKTYVLSFLSSLVMAYVLGWAVQSAQVISAGAGAMMGFWAWLGYIATVELGTVLWENKPWKLYFINAGHYLVTLLVMGVILGLWG